jgi:hypothetical protein
MDADYQKLIDDGRGDVPLRGRWRMTANDRESPIILSRWKNVEL